MTKAGIQLKLARPLFLHRCLSVWLREGISWYLICLSDILWLVNYIHSLFLCLHNAYFWLDTFSTSTWSISQGQVHLESWHLSLSRNKSVVRSGLPTDGRLKDNSPFISSLQELGFDSFVNICPRILLRPSLHILIFGLSKKNAFRIYGL